MGEDRSLDEFLGKSGADSVGDGESPEEDTERSEPNDGDIKSPNDGDAEDAKPAVATFRWSSTGAACDACGETVQRRWRDEETDGFVCIDCKPW
ncbi:hypothetical protein [Haloprofundus sp. MHR1]|uniref:DUF7573 domain-containing protein n=1 Tax=Haloprofundus sp. MHR1 TaxID=2572921 RepID=UPI0010BED67D|nr:hypothetical protein [Haloprofundus sp. MHR1]QCJ45726.1 hypothetical protein FCF25_00700 [Haloprofundus sp. MHR1]